MRVKVAKLKYSSKKLVKKVIFCQFKLLFMNLYNKFVS